MHEWKHTPRNLVFSQTTASKRSQDEFCFSCVDPRVLERKFTLLRKLLISHMSWQRPLMRWFLCEKVQTLLLPYRNTDNRNSSSPLKHIKVCSVFQSSIQDEITIPPYLALEIAHVLNASIHYMTCINISNGLKLWESHQLIIVNRAIQH